MIRRRLLLLEFNELSAGLIDRFINAGDLPNFRRLRESSACFSTDASAEHTLEPWTQWPTLHSGVPDSIHGIQHLGEAGRLAGRGLSCELAAAGHRVGIFGSMNIAAPPADTGFFMPDPWAPGGRCQPPVLHDFFDFVAGAVQENASNGLPRDKALRFARCLLRNGLTPATVALALRQLEAERRAPALTWRRSLVLDALSYDVFRHLTRKHSVDFATFFSNSTAHFQHYFWRNLEPGLFSAPPLETDDPSLAAAIRTGYQGMDRLIGRALKDFADWRIVLATALSQQPWDTDKTLWRPRHVADLLTRAGVDPSHVSIEPVMAEEFFFHFNSADAADAGEAGLAALRCAGGPLLRMQREGARIKAGSAINTWLVDSGLQVTGPGGARPFVELFHRIHGVRSGRHHPAGLLWVQSSRPDPHAGTIPLSAVAPTILNLFGLDRPAYMADPAVEFAGV